ncbi:hypothetical protein O181_038096 [Austropuccinia psidii MF-1]|uniref:Uncharacterized protein n=1 Tax=Austropuccinia psidii MF-1 TaxID=1389203 RepID=A0A9Q3DDC7_9BASI|nr:hypothetical protein [Austropuccinia psidii MF-1]
MLQEEFHIHDEIIVGKLHSLFTRTAKKWYYKMRQDHGKHDWSWWKSEVITKCANNSWRFKAENSFESAIFNSENDKPLTWFFKQKDRLASLHPDMSDTMINMKMWRRTGACYQTNINEVQVIEEAQCTEEKEESDLDSAVYEDTPVEDYPIEIITASFEVTEVHTHLSQYSENCDDLINIQDGTMCKTKPARGKGYTAGASCITSILMNDIEVKVNLDTGAFCTSVGKDYLQAIIPG